MAWIYLTGLSRPEFEIRTLESGKEERRRIRFFMLVAQCTVCLCLDMVRMNNLEIRVVPNMITDNSSPLNL